MGKKNMSDLGLLGGVVWIDLLEQVLNIESSDFRTGRGESWGGKLMFCRLVDCVKEETEMVRC